MLGRQIFGYAPSLIVPGIVSFATVYSLTRLLSPESYGHYVLAINSMTMILGVGFFWLQSAASRLLPQEVEQGREFAFTATLYRLYLITVIVMSCGAALIVALCPLGDWRLAAWFAPPLAALRALLNINQAYHRNFTRIARYNMIETGQSVLGLGCALGLIVLLRMGAAGAVLGGMVGLFVMTLVDWRSLAVIRWHSFDRAIFRDILAFGLPFVVNYGLSFVLSRSDSFLIQIFWGPADVGIYNAGYALPDRVGQYLFMAVATASLPLTVRRLEQEGVQAARDQTAINGAAMLALVVPACVGLLFANKTIIDLMIGSDFRAGAARIMPWITGAMIVNGLAAHYFDHAFHLAKKTRLYFYTLGPSAAFNFVANLILIPRYGPIGAAWTTLAAYVLYLVLSIIVGRRVFAIKFPFKIAGQIVLSTLFMAGVLHALEFADSFWGLAAMMAIGAMSYACGVLLFDIMGARSFLMKKYVELRMRG